MEKIDDTLSYIPLTEIPQIVTEEEIITLEILKEHDMRVRNYILASMSNDLQGQLEHFMSAASMIQHLKNLFGKHSQTTRYEILKKLFQDWMLEGLDIGDYVISMINMIFQLDVLEFPINTQLQTDIVLQSLPDSFSSFIIYFYMNKIECSLPELLNILIIA